MLCMTHTLAYSGGGAHTVTPGSELARTLQQSACKGSDPPLPIVLPHCKATRSGGRGGVCPPSTPGALFPCGEKPAQIASGYASNAPCFTCRHGHLRCGRLASWLSGTRRQPGATCVQGTPSCPGPTPHGRNPGGCNSQLLESLFRFWGEFTTMGSNCWCRCSRL